MSEWKLPWDAACLCGRVKMRVTAAPLMAMACHCRGCQKLTSGAYSLTFILPAQGFEVLEGETAFGGKHGEYQQHYCAHCKSWIYTTGGGPLEGFVNLRPTMLEDASWVLPFVDLNTAEKLPGVVTGAKRSYEGFPPPADFPTLMEAFAREGARPGSSA
jgi:hypothetical protein